MVQLVYNCVALLVKIFFSSLGKEDNSSLPARQFWRFSVNPRMIAGSWRTIKPIGLTRSPNVHKFKKQTQTHKCRNESTADKESKMKSSWCDTGGAGDKVIQVQEIRSVVRNFMNGIIEECMGGYAWIKARGQRLRTDSSTTTESGMEAGLKIGQMRRSHNVPSRHNFLNALTLTCSTTWTCILFSHRALVQPFNITNRLDGGTAAVRRTLMCFVRQNSVISVLVAFFELPYVVASWLHPNFRRMLACWMSLYDTALISWKPATRRGAHLSYHCTLQWMSSSLSWKQLFVWLLVPSLSRLYARWDLLRIYASIVKDNNRYRLAHLEVVSVLMNWRLLQCCITTGNRVLSNASRASLGGLRQRMTSSRITS